MKDLKAYEQEMNEIVHDVRVKASGRTRTIETPACPACSSTRGSLVKGQVYSCAKCGGLHGTCYLGESYTFVLPSWEMNDVPAEMTRYFDLTCLGSEGITRRHGWYFPASKRIVQVG